ncbi:MAG: leucine-rich repeat domain-containing protein [Clostridia bacterium]|nr:leucine-rich repeat domain-containing protein [Clostridia bacterium]
MSDLKDFVIENGVLKKYVGPGGDVVIPEGVTSIAADVFFFSKTLTSITIPKTLTRIGPRAFERCQQLKAVFVSDLVSWMNVKFGDYGSSPVRYADSIYINGELLTHLVVPEEVLQINNATFACASITKITIPYGRTTINDHAFANCPSLVSVSIPNSVTSIGYEAFKKCSALTSIVIPNSVTKMGYRVFEKCSSLETITLSENVKTISSNLFWGCSALKNITLPDSVTEIDSLAFSGCSSLTSLVIPPKVEEIQIDSFCGCENLCSLTLPEGIKRIIKPPKLLGCPIESCTALNHLNCINNSDRVRKLFWQSVGKVKKEIFCFAYLENDDTLPAFVKQYMTSNLKGLLELSVQQNNITAFTKLIHLKRQLSIDEFNEFISICETNQEMSAILLDYKNQLYSAEDIDAHETNAIEKDLGFREKTLADWAKMYQLNVSENAVTINKYKSNDTEVIIPEMIDGKPVVAIGEAAFSGKPITSVVIPECVETIHKGAFRNCKELVSITLPPKITVLADGLFKNCSSLTTFNLPETITGIGIEAFSGCKALAQFNTPKRVTEIDDCAFWGCTSLSNFSWPDQLLTLGESVFRDCKSLTAITVPDTIKIIKRNLFQGCSALIDIGIPDAVEEIHGNIVYDTAFIKDKKNFKNGALCIGKHLIRGWKVKDSDYRIPDGIEILHRYCFCVNKTLENIVIPDSVTKICEGAFMGCETLKNAYISASVTEMGEDVFTSETLTIHAPAGSYAEQYAKENNIPFVAE